MAFFSGSFKRNITYNVENATLLVRHVNDWPIGNVFNNSQYFGIELVNKKIWPLYLCFIFEGVLYIWKLHQVQTHVLATISCTSWFSFLFSKYKISSTTLILFEFWIWVFAFQFFRLGAQILAMMFFSSWDKTGHLSFEF